MQIDMANGIIFVPADCDCWDDECNDLHRNLWFFGDVAYFTLEDAERAAFSDN